jgi:hypothetical protein
VRGRSSTVIWTKYCGTATKVGGNRENKRGPVVMGVSCLLENLGKMGMGYWIVGFMVIIVLTTNFKWIISL